MDTANNVAIKSAEAVNQAVANATRAKRRLYWMTLVRYLSVHIWSITFTGTLMWVLDGSSEGVAMFVAYVGAYTGQISLIPNNELEACANYRLQVCCGIRYDCYTRNKLQRRVLISFKYSKIFSGPHALKPLLLAAAFALPVGILLKKALPLFAYASVIALALSTWLAAFLSFRTVELGTPVEQSKDQASHNEIYHAYDPPSADLRWSQEELKARYHILCGLPTLDRFEIKPSDSHGARIKEALSRTYDSLSQRNVLLFSKFVDGTLEAFEDGNALVELVPSGAIWDGQSSGRALSRCRDGILHLFVEADNGAKDIWSNSRT